MSFENLGLMAELLRAVSDKGYSTPSPIQEQAIPQILEGRDIMGAAQTGTGKTAGFVLPLLQRLMLSKQEQKGTAVRALVLAPTRELVSQVSESVATYGRYLPLKYAAVFGGVKINPQKQRLRQGVDVLVATPGRLLDLISQKSVKLSNIEVFVLDEADRMLDMGFIRDIRKIIQLLPKNKQTLFFSATFSSEIKGLTKSLFDSPVVIEVAQQNATAEHVKHIVHPVDNKRKRALLSYLIGSNNWQQVLVFCRTKHGSNRLCDQLNLDGLTTTAIHGDKTQGARTKALDDFKSGKVRVLVATDIAARGLDINQLPHVVNFDLPHVAEDYVHRVGRTGRAGHEGEAISLVGGDELPQLRSIEHLIQQTITKVTVKDFEPTYSTTPKVVHRSRNRSPKRPSRSFGGQKPRAPSRPMGRRT